MAKSANSITATNERNNYGMIHTTQQDDFNEGPTIRGGSRRWSFGGQIKGSMGRKYPSGVLGRSPSRQSGGSESSRSWSIFKVHNLKFKAI